MGINVEEIQTSASDLLLKTAATRTHKLTATRHVRNYRKLFIDGAEYVFDGNRVKAKFRIPRNGVGHWRLHTIDPDVSLKITPDEKIRTYRGKVVDLVRPFESVFDTIRPLDEAIWRCEAICRCSIHGHAWGPVQYNLDCPKGSFAWQWCLICGAERVWCDENAEWLEWPKNADEIKVRTCGALPTLHGPVLRGTRPEELRHP